MNGHFKTFSTNCSGNLSIIAALAVIPVALAGGVAVDFGHGSTVASNLQEALDAAVLAGVAEKYDNVAAAKAAFIREVPDKNPLVSNVSFVKSGSVTITGTLTATVPTTFSRLLGLNALTFRLTSVAQGGASNSNDLCILTLAPAQSQEFLANGGANVNASTCTVNIGSTANPAAIFNSGTTINSKKLCIQGSQIIDNGGTHPNLQLGCTPPSDPYAGKISAPLSTACDYQNMNYSGAVALNPGTYCGWTNFNAGTNVTLNAGTYIIKSGGWNVNGGTWSGNGVTFYYADTSKIQFNSAVAATLTAPASGNYKDILMAETPGLANTQFIFDDSNGFDMEGIVYLPSRDVVFNSNSTTRSHNMTAIMNSLIVNSTLWTLTPYQPSGSSGNALVRLTQ